MNVTDEMVDASHRVMARDGWTCEYHEPTDPGECKSCDEVRGHTIGRILAAALAAAPTVDGWVWCDYDADVNADGVTQSTFCVNAATLKNPDHACPGPHRSLIIGPEVTP